MARLFELYGNSAYLIYRDNVVSIVKDTEEGCKPLWRGTPKELYAQLGLEQQTESVQPEMSKGLKAKTIGLLEVRPDFDVVIVAEKTAITLYFSDQPGESITAVLHTLVERSRGILIDTTRRDDCGEESTLHTKTPSLCLRLKVSPVFDILKLASAITKCMSNNFVLRAKLVNESGVVDKIEAQASVQQVYRAMDDFAKREKDLALRAIAAENDFITEKFIKGKL